MKKTKWFVPAIITVCFAAIDIMLYRRMQQRIDFNLFLGTKAFSFVGTIIFYNLFVVYRSERKRVEYFLAFPMLLPVVAFMFTSLTWQYFGPIIAATLGLGFATFGIAYHLQETGLKKRCTVQATATVVGNEVERTSRKQNGGMRTLTYRPRLAYEVKGVTLEQLHGNGQPNPMEIGRKIEILYDPASPGDFCFAEPENDVTARVVPTVFIVLGVVCMVVSIVILIR